MNGMTGMTSMAQASAPQASAGQRLMPQALAPHQSTAQGVAVTPQALPPELLSITVGNDAG